MEWISVKDRLPPNGQYLGALCQRCLVNTRYGVTEGWFNPDQESWFILLWRLGDGRPGYDPIDLERGTVPVVAQGNIVTHWMLMPDDPAQMEENAK